MTGRVEGVRGYHDITRYPHRVAFPTWYCFVGTHPSSSPTPELFHQRVLDAITESPTPVRRIVVTAEPVIAVTTQPTAVE